MSPEISFQVIYREKERKSDLNTNEFGTVFNTKILFKKNRHHNPVCYITTTEIFDNIDLYFDLKSPFIQLFPSKYLRDLRTSYRDIVLQRILIEDSGFPLFLKLIKFRKLS